MSTFRKRSLTILLSWLSLSDTHAQLTDGGIRTHCPFRTSLNWTEGLNSTGTQAFRFDTALAGTQDWYFSVTYNDTRGPNAPSAPDNQADQAFRGWLSVPDDRQPTLGAFCRSWPILRRAMAAL